VHMQVPVLTTLLVVQCLVLTLTQQTTPALTHLIMQSILMPVQ